MNICYTGPETSMVRDGCNNFSFWAIFCPFTPKLQNTPYRPKDQNLKKIKNMPASLFYTSVPKIMIICYTVPEIWCVTDVIIFHFGLFFALSPP